MDLKDAERLLEDVVSKSCVVASPRQISDEAGAEGGVPRAYEMGPCPQEGQASEGGSIKMYNDVDEAALHARVSDLGRPFIPLQR